MLEPCIGFFLRRFNTPDALICYVGSIEKLSKLLQSERLTYFLTYYRMHLAERIILHDLKNTDTVRIR